MNTYQNKKKILLNFLPIEVEQFRFSIWYRVYRDGKKKWSENIKKFKLPDDSGKYIYFWVSFEQFENAYNREISSDTNVELTKFYLFNLLKAKLREANIHFEQREKEKIFAPNHLYIITEETGFGKKTIRIEPYYLKIKRKFGFLVDYKFLKSQGIPFDRKIQQLSFSLDEHYKSNVNYHIDKYEYITGFIKKHLALFSNISSELKISENFEELEYESLITRRYVFKNQNVDNSQFNGLMTYGPYRYEENSIKYFYIFYQKHKEYVNELIKALNGETYKTFPGLEKLNLPNQTAQNTIGIPINSFDEIPESFLSKVEINEKSILIAIFPKKEEKFYYSLKNYCLRKDIPLQTVHLETIIDENKLKWSLSGISLQILVKLGNIPWLVEAENTECLIVGIGQSIERDKSNQPIRFFTYAVLLTSSGKFLTIETLSYSLNKEDCLREISQKIGEIIKKESSNYRKIVFHIPEKIKRDTIKEIENTLKNIRGTGIELHIIRVNDDSKFFGYDINNNSLIPYESSYIQLSPKEFLLWTEGLNYHNPTPKKRYSNPIYIDFYYSKQENQENIDYKSFLQDILNLSGANYRGFNAKSLPVSMYYPKLISNFYKNFQKYKLSTITETRNKMWFL